MSFCYKSAKIWLLIGKIFFALKILIPLVIIILGSIDVAKAVMASDDKAISKSATTLLKRVIIGVVIFFVPTLIKLAFNLVGKFDSDIKNDYNNCFNCLTNPYNKCDTSYEGEIFK